MQKKISDIFLHKEIGTNSCGHHKRRSAWSKLPLPITLLQVKMSFTIVWIVVTEVVDEQKGEEREKRDIIAYSKRFNFDRKVLITSSEKAYHDQCKRIA